MTTEEEIVLTPEELRRFEADTAEYAAEQERWRQREVARRLRRTDHLALRMLGAFGNWRDSVERVRTGEAPLALRTRDRNSLFRWAERFADALGELDEISGGTVPPNDWGNQDAERQP